MITINRSLGRTQRNGYSTAIINSPTQGGQKTAKKKKKLRENCNHNFYPNNEQKNNYELYSNNIVNSNDTI